MQETGMGYVATYRSTYVWDWERKVFWLFYTPIFAGCYYFSRIYSYLF